MWSSLSHARTVVITNLATEENLKKKKKKKNNTGLLKGHKCLQCYCNLKRLQSVILSGLLNICDLSIKGMTAAAY